MHTMSGLRVNRLQSRILEHGVMATLPPFGMQRNTNLVKHVARNKGLHYIVGFSRIIQCHNFKVSINMCALTSTITASSFLEMSQRKFHTAWVRLAKISLRLVFSGMMNHCSTRIESFLPLFFYCTSTPFSEIEH